jgi:hypothetical protein
MPREMSSGKLAEFVTTKAGVVPGSNPRWGRHVWKCGALGSGLCGMESTQSKTYDPLGE